MRVLETYDTQSRRIQAQGQYVKAGDQKQEANAWTAKTGWPGNLRGLDLKALRESTRPPTEEEALLQAMTASMATTMKKAWGLSSSDNISRQVLYELRRNDAYRKPERPFDGRMEASTWDKYTGVWRKMLSFWQRSRAWQEDKRPPYTLTTAQQRYYNDWCRACQDGQGGETAKRACVDFLLSLLDHNLGDSTYESSLLSGLAVLGIRQDNAWVDAYNYTPIFSAVLKIARILVLYQSDLEGKEEEATTKTEGKQTTLFQRVRQKVCRFLVRVSNEPETQPTPVDWILDTRAYGMRIVQTTPSAGRT